MNFKKLKPETRNAMRAFHAKAQSNEGKLIVAQLTDGAKKALSQRAFRSTLSRGR